MLSQELEKKNFPMKNNICKTNVKTMQEEFYIIPKGYNKIEIKKQEDNNKNGKQ